MTDTSREALIRELRCAHAVQSDEGPSTFSEAADMLEADKRKPVCPSCQAPGLLYECVHCSANSYPKGFVQQAKREPLSDAAIEDIWMIAREANDFPKVFAQAIEAAHGIGAKL